MSIAYFKDSWWGHLVITIFIVMQNKSKEEKLGYLSELTMKVTPLKIHIAKEPSLNFRRLSITENELDSISRSIYIPIEKHIDGSKK